MAGETSTPSGKELALPKGSNNASPKCPLTCEEHVAATHFMVPPGKPSLTWLVLGIFGLDDSAA